MSKKLLKALRNQKEETQQIALEIYGTLGIPIDGSRTVDVPNRPSFVYVKLRDNQNEIIQAFNNQVAASYGLPVIVVREGNRYIVQGVNTQRYQNNWNNNAPYLPKHGTVHSFSDGGGGDVSWIFSRQFMPNLVYPGGGGTTGSYAYIASHVLLNNANQWKFTGATGTPNLLPYKGTGSSSAMLLIYLDANSGNPGVLVGSGSYFPNSLTGTASIFPYIPIPDPATQIPLAAVRLDTGTSAVTWDNLYDMRQWIHARPSGTSSGGGGGGGIDTIGFAGLTNGIPIGTGTVLNVRGGASFSRSGTIFDLNVLPHGNDQIGIFGQNQGIPLATGTILNVNGSRLSLSASGTVLNLTNSPDPIDNIGIYGMSGTVGLGTGTSISFSNGIIASITGTTLYARANYSDMSGVPAAETNANNIFSVSSPGGTSLWAATINGAPAGTSVTVNAPSSGTEAVLVPVSTAQLAKMRLYNITRGNSALISNYNTVTNVITLTASVPANWANGDSLTVVSQTVSGGGFDWIDLEITSGPTSKNAIFMFCFYTTAAAGDSLRVHPFETFGTGKVFAIVGQVASVLTGGIILIKITSNVFSIAWTGTPTAVTLREAGFL